MTHEAEGIVLSGA